MWLTGTYLLVDDDPDPLPPPEPLLLVVVLPPPVLVELLPTLPGLAAPPLIELPALPMPLDPCRLLEPLWPVEPKLPEPPEPLEPPEPPMSFWPRRRCGCCASW
ncbi:hypothetical protein HK414_09295 [Ramlibacter terrae]|uniref:Secreted protein n=1 Tax=Ramlibacter terrae TaxID=2732511 RepID=A0ABX6P1R2_9BURK|nr:hypothetical protein HK414_09295 [Ramlibacter terrae]